MASNGIPEHLFHTQKKGKFSNNIPLKKPGSIINNGNSQKNLKYSSQRRFNQLTKDIPRLDGRTGKYHQSDLYTSMISNKKQNLSERIHLLNQANPIMSLNDQFNSQTGKNLNKSASGKYFSKTCLDRVQDNNLNRQKQHQNKHFNQKNKNHYSIKEKNRNSFQNNENSNNKLKSLVKHSYNKKTKNLHRFQPFISLFLLQVVMNVLFAIPAVYQFFTLDSIYKRYLATIQYCFLTAYYIGCSVYIAWGHGIKGFIQFFMMHFLVDNLLLILVVVIIGFIGMLTVSFSNEWFSWINLIGVPIMHFFFIGNFRLFLKWVRLKSWQIVLWKITFFVDGLSYFCIGAYYMAADYKITGGFLPNLQSKLKDFILLFVFANFSLFIEMFGSIGGKDKTQDLQYEYIFQQDSDDQVHQKIKSEIKCDYCKHCNPNKQFETQLSQKFKRYKTQRTKNNNQNTLNQVDLNKDILFQIPEQSPVGNQQITIDPIVSKNKVTDK